MNCNIKGCEGHRIKATMKDPFLGAFCSTHWSMLKKHHEGKYAYVSKWDEEQQDYIIHGGRI